jgi:hypothetical protein
MWPRSKCHPKPPRNAPLRALRAEVQTALREERRLRDIIASADPSFLPAQSVKPLSYAEMQGCPGPRHCRCRLVLVWQ